MDVNFSDEIEEFKKALKEKRNLLEELEEKRNSHAEQTRRARQALEDLRAVLRGETPPSKRTTKTNAAGISKVPVNDETGRPPRGARRQQIHDICRKVGAGGEVFRTADVLKVLREVEDEVLPGKRSYTYTVMNKLEDDGIVERRGRGKWVLTE